MHRGLLIGIVALAGLVLVGCTMCPSKYDYSGPVPGGAATQNDFRARSNGILPINAAPRPWPPIVRGGEPAGGPAAEPGVVVASGVEETVR